VVGNIYSINFEEQKHVHNIQKMMAGYTSVLDCGFWNGPLALELAPLFSLYYCESWTIRRISHMDSVWMIRAEKLTMQQ